MMYFLTSLLLGLISTTRVSAGPTLVQRDDVSFYKPGVDKPALEDVVEYYKDIGPNADSFDYSIMAAVHAMVSLEPARIAKLFTAKADSRWEVSHYDPMTHGREAATLGFDQVSDLQGNKKPEKFKQNWWVAALHTRLSELWDGRKSFLDKDKTAAYDSMFEVEYISLEAPYIKIGQLDVHGLHWILSVLTARKIGIYDYAFEPSPVDFTVEDTRKAIGKSPLVLLPTTMKATADRKTAPEDGGAATVVKLDDDADRLYIDSVLRGDQSIAVKDATALLLLAFEDRGEEWGEDWFEREAKTYPDVPIHF